MLSRARADPGRLFIGLDANRAGLVAPSRRAAAKPRRGGLRNAAFVHGALEELPGPLAGIAGEMTVLFPWGTLLRAVATPDAALLAAIRATCQPGASFESAFSLAEADAAELQRLGIGKIDTPALIASYLAAGFTGVELTQLRPAETAAVGTAWAKRLANRSSRREVWRLQAMTP